MTVSVLIPAYRPTFLRQAIGSVLTQGYTDYELLINDDSRGDEVAAIVAEFRDSRIRYSRTAGGEGSAENIRQLWARASHPLVKYLFDDDMLTPHALTTLMDQMQAKPAAAYVFGHRDWIDAEGRIRQRPRVLKEGAVAVLSRAQLAELMIEPCTNRIGEFTNVLMNRATGVDLDDMFVYAGQDVAMCVDVALFLNATAKGLAVGVGETVAQYRKHADQNSTFGFNPEFYRGFFEWDVFLRGEYRDGHLSAERALKGVEKLRRGYASWHEKLPELRILSEGLSELAAKIRAADRDVFDEGFRSRWAAADQAARERVARQPQRIDLSAGPPAA